MRMLESCEGSERLQKTVDIRDAADYVNGCPVLPSVILMNVEPRGI